ncbi:hypothetical protein PQH03_17980 [Ralstonia insidiosa]|jgi:hypothetical protein|uniref:hypothetical protein n=1 Tax=Ralstonia TaxID=48736 RepID=UPI000664A3AF|nr:hypothetical protein [Ralstonia insidiosa]KMW46939.1 hypothetical protein AC240_13605 [Ralstonia sp. MD27]MBX3771051.1 hypothetical protein [Ralstonia pickettii]NOZ18923.1 hypothetical protein [Betaproteobacteria bacterium]MBA9855705.1 hypothetical protein [Ralstonia insidiosa]MBA9870054.1 hypothetical protein [Ralstonia insidiosa]
MVYLEINWADFKYMLDVLSIDRAQARWEFHEGEMIFLGHEAENLLVQAEEQAATLLERFGEEPNPNIHYSRLQRTLSGFYLDRLENLRFGLDFNAELRFREHIVSEETYPSLYRYLVAIPGDKGFGLDREDHQFGYHIHYVQMNGKRVQRSNAIFVFNPAEPPVPKPVLYWEPHHEGAQVHINPGVFGVRRRMAIYDTCTPFLNQIPKTEFKTPSKKKAQRFHP